jgi:serine/threonine protein kinase
MPVGRGGMGEVYRADDLKLGQAVALKFLPERVQHDPGRIARLLAEVRLARQVSHPNVARVWDVGEVEGRHFLSMEFVDGEDLASLLRRVGRLPEDRALQVARQLCAGLAAAHEVGILHRDLKPSNVMIDGRGRVRITDFGLAVVAESVEGLEVRAGTPAYMAPEQLAGREVTLRSDLYALGLVLYELFTGQPAFEDGSTGPVDGGRTSTPKPPSSHVKGLDPAVEAAILRCLEPDPRARPPSALLVAAALPGGDPLAEPRSPRVRRRHPSWWRLREVQAGSLPGSRSRAWGWCSPASLESRASRSGRPSFTGSRSTSPRRFSVTAHRPSCRSWGIGRRRRTRTWDSTTTATTSTTFGSTSPRSAVRPG